MSVDKLGIKAWYYFRKKKNGKKSAEALRERLDSVNLIKALCEIRLILMIPQQGPYNYKRTSWKPGTRRKDCE